MKMKKNDEVFEGSWLMLMPSESIATTKEPKDTHTFIYSLPHPKTNKVAKFVIKETDASEASLYEINKHQESFSSWFVDEKVVKSDGSLHIVTKFDALYILLAQLFKDKTGKFVVIDQLFSDYNCTRNVGAKLLSCLKQKSQMNNIADAAGTDDLAAYRYNEAKTLLWVKRKVERTASAINASLMFIAEDEENETEDECKLRYACGMVCEYLPNELHAKVWKYLGIRERNEKRKGVGFNSASKKAKTDALDDSTKVDSNSTKSSKKKSISRAQKALNKVDKKGMKTMSSFFAVKPKTS